MVVAAESPPVSVDRVVEELASHESNAESRSSSDDPSDQIAVSVVHCHLPKLQDAEIVDVDSETGTVTEGIQFDDAMDHIRAAETIQ